MIRKGEMFLSFLDYILGLIRIVMLEYEVDILPPFGIYYVYLH